MFSSRSSSSARPSWLLPLPLANVSANNKPSTGHTKSEHALTVHLVTAYYYTTTEPSPTSTVDTQPKTIPIITGKDPGGCGFRMESLRLPAGPVKTLDAGK